ncbi:hypothetical protein GCM10025868_07560 [Angustibacter aerolatus]|uniref:Holliday junction DNA helicase RuvA C-terminal domain-containing protein n=1 Tax=Angustibacter aerolatus TaxID=1162965 RepID=A0ABQ6JFG1_9ACTN|nr:hypothetical protein GCM10025868_07560 [Angustibacter aerolatus]
MPEADAIRMAFLRGAGFAADGAARLLEAADAGTAPVREVRLSAALVAE